MYSHLSNTPLLKDGLGHLVKATTTASFWKHGSHGSLCTSQRKITNSMNQSPSWEANSCSASQGTPHLSWYLNVYYLITVYTRVSHWILSWARWIESTSPHPTYLWSILILSFHIYLGLSSGHLPFCYPYNIFIRGLYLK